MDRNDQIKWTEKTILILNKTLPKGDIEFKDWQSYERLLNSCLCCTQWIIDLCIINVDAGFLLFRIATYLCNAKADYSKSEILLNRSLVIYEHILGKEHPYVVACLNNLAELYRICGKYEQAELLYNQSLVIREKSLGKYHPHVAQILNNFGIAFIALGVKNDGNFIRQQSFGCCILSE